MGDNFVVFMSLGRKTGDSFIIIFSDKVTWPEPSLKVHENFEKKM